MSPGGGSNSQNSTAVLNAFKELKVKAKGLETELKDIQREAESLRSQLSVSRRQTYVRRGPRELQLAESLQFARSEAEVKRKEVGELERDLVIMEDASRSIERGLTSSRTRLASVEDDAHYIISNLKEHELTVKSMEEELATLNERCEYLQSRVAALPQAKEQQTQRMKEAVATMENELVKIQSATDQNKIRSAGLHRYIEMMIATNSELCDTILAREEAKARVMRITGHMSPPPSGVGSAFQPYNEVLSNIAKNAVDSSLKNEAQQAIKDARAVLHMHSKLYADISGKPRPSSSGRPTSSSSSARGPKAGKKLQAKPSSGSSSSSSNNRKNFAPKDLLSRDVNEIARAAEQFARQASAAANLHGGYGPAKEVYLTRGTPDFNTASSSPLSSSTRGSPNWRPIEIALSGGAKESPVFVPAGKPGKDTYNAFASVSKAVRAAKTWNAQIASHIKSISQGGHDFLDNGARF